MEAVPRIDGGRKQFLATDGVMGFSMLAEPLRKHYATLSVWRDAKALETFSGRIRTVRLILFCRRRWTQRRSCAGRSRALLAPPSWSDTLARLHTTQ